MSKNNTLIFIGTIKKVANCGESMKNHLFIDRFRELFNRVITIDIFQPRKHPLCFLKVILVAVTHRHQKILLSVSPVTANKFLKLLLALGCDNVYYWTVGFSIMNCFKRMGFDITLYNRLKAIMVQSNSMTKELESYGLNNVIYVPNSKPINHLPDITTRPNDIIRFIFLSRVHPQKGCQIIVNSAYKLCEMGYSDKFLIDFYGQIQEGYEVEFESMVSKCKNVQYKGFLDLKEPKNYDTLSMYNVMLFPTYYDGEAFPGVIIDAYIAGLPVIASDWHLNKELIEPQVGWIIPARDENALLVMMKDILDKKYDLDAYSRNCQEKAMLFDNKLVLSIEKLQKIGLLDNN